MKSKSEFIESLIDIDDDFRDVFLICRFARETSPRKIE